jgi:type III secretion system FlhB-like substrate exporter
MKIRLVSKKHVKNAYEKKNNRSKIDLKEELAIENIEEVPKELFQILGETLSFIESVNNMEVDKDEDKQ